MCERVYWTRCIEVMIDILTFHNFCKEIKYFLILSDLRLTECEPRSTSICSPDRVVLVYIVASKASREVQDDLRPVCRDENRGHSNIIFQGSGI